MTTGMGKRQHVADDVSQSLFENAHQAFALERIVDARIRRIHVDRQLAFTPEVVVKVFMRGKHVLHVDAEARAQSAKELAGHRFRAGTRPGLVGDQRALVPHRLTIAAPEAVQ